jgi:Zn-dependent protease
MACFLVVVVIWVFSVCLHEYGHAIVALKGGDYTVEEKGYLSMNPIHYAHPVTSFLLPILFVVMGGLALPGGAVYINKNLLRSKGWETAVSLAGPAMNFIECIVLVLILRLYLIPYHPDHVGTFAVAFSLQLQISAILFNLIPIPPLDGYQAIEPWLPYELRQSLAPLSQYGLFIIFLLFWNVDAASNIFWSCVFNISNFCGVDPELGILGYHLFHFWK